MKRQKKLHYDIVSIAGIIGGKLCQQVNHEIGTGLLYFSDLQVKLLVYKGDSLSIYILTNAEATCLAMVNIRLSVMSHGGFILP